MSYWNESELHVEAFSKLNCWNLHQTKEHTCFLVKEALLRSKSEMIVFSKINLRRLINLLFSKIKRALAIRACDVIQPFFDAATAVALLAPFFPFPLS